MENTQWSWHCEHRHSSSSDNYVFSPERLQFSRRQYKQTGRGREKHVKHAHSNFNQRGRPWGWLTKWRKKNSFIVEEACQFAVTMTWPWKNWGGLYSCAVNVLCTNRVPVVYSKVWKYLYSDSNYINLGFECQYHINHRGITTIFCPESSIFKVSNVRSKIKCPF